MEWIYLTTKKMLNDRDMETSDLSKERITHIFERIRVWGYNEK